MLIYMTSAVVRKILLLSLVSLALIAITFVLMLEKQMQRPLAISEAQLLTVDKGTSVSALAQKLTKQGWLESRFWLRSYARLYPNEVQIKAGTYLVPPNSNLQAILELIASGKEHQFQLTFVEGTSFKQWLTQLQNQPQLTHSLNSLTVEEISKRLGIAQTNPEGWFFPETYAFTQGTDELELLKRAYGVMQATLMQLWQDRASELPYETPYQALIMASIIEKETSYLPEQPLIASVFINRLAKKMRLQTDPTVIYGLGERYQGDITRAHLREKTLYNTYRINGLPPTPIAMPGLSAIKAALNPQTSDYYYFVSTGDGRHVFSKTLAQHNTAVKDYLAKQKNIQK